jgi:hypothetical protein
MCLPEAGCERMDRIDLHQDRKRWRPLVNAVMNLRVQGTAGNFYIFTSVHTHLGGVQLKFWFRDWLSRQVFRRCPQHLVANSGIVP